MQFLIFPLLLAQSPDIDKLSSDSWQVRHSATMRLCRAGETVRADLEKAEKSADPEQSGRARMILRDLNAKRRTAAIAAVDARWPTLPWIDMAWYDANVHVIDSAGNLWWGNAWARDALWPYLNVAPNEADAHGWGKFRGATRLWLYDLHERGAPLAGLEWILQEMRYREGAYMLSIPRPAVKGS